MTGFATAKNADQSRRRVSITKPSRIVATTTIVASLVIGGALVGATPAGAASKKFANCTALLKTYRNGVAATKKVRA